MSVARIDIYRSYTRTSVSPALRQLPPQGHPVKTASLSLPVSMCCTSHSQRALESASLSLFFFVPSQPSHTDVSFSSFPNPQCLLFVHSVNTCQGEPWLFPMFFFSPVKGGKTLRRCFLWYIPYNSYWNERFPPLICIFLKNENKMKPKYKQTYGYGNFILASVLSIAGVFYSFWIYNKKNILKCLIWGFNYCETQQFIPLSNQKDKIKQQ